MWKFFVAAFIAALLQNRHYIEDRFFGPTIEDFPNGYSVVIYGAAWCRYCRKVRKFLELKGFEYREYDIETSAKAHEEFTALGGIGVPLVVINGSIIRGYDRKAMLTALANQ